MATKGKKNLRELEMPKGNNKGDSKRDENVDIATPGKMSDRPIAKKPKVDLVLIFMVASGAVIGILVAFVFTLNQQQNDFLERMQKLEESITRDCKVQCLSGKSVQIIEDRIRDEKNQLNVETNKMFNEMKAELQEKLNSYMPKATAHDAINTTAMDGQLAELMQKNTSEVWTFILKEVMNALDNKLGDIQSTFKQLLKAVEKNVHQQVGTIQDQFQRFKNQLEEFKSSLSETPGNTMNIDEHANVTMLKKELMEIKDTMHNTAFNLNTTFMNITNKLHENILNQTEKLSTALQAVNGTLLNTTSELNTTVINNTNGLKELNTTLLDINGTLWNTTSKLNITVMNTTNGLGELNVTLLDINGTLWNTTSELNITVINNTNGLKELNTTLLDINGTLWNTTSKLSITVMNTTDGLRELNATLLDINGTLWDTTSKLNITVMNTTDGLGELNVTLLDINGTLWNTTSKLNIIVKNTKDGLGELNTTLLDINGTLWNTTFKLNSTLMNTTDGLGVLNTTLLDVNGTLWNTTSELNLTLINTTNRLGVLNTTLLDVNETLWNTTFELNSTLMNTTNGLGELNTTSLKMKISLHEVKEYARRVDVIVKKNEDEIGNIKSKSDLFKEVILDKVDRTREKVENVERDNISFGMYFILILVAMVIMVFLIVNWVHVKFRDGQSLFNRMYSTTGVSHPTRLSQPLRSVLDDIGRKQLENKVCILSFYAETQNLHKRLTDSACQGLHIMQEQYLIGKHEHVPNIPPCRIVLVFVDFNERDIILENPKREVGDLKLTTVKGARKMGCDVFVIYVRDKGSKALVDGKLFNPNLMSVFEHEELRDLNGRKRVMSTYENFTQYQVRHLYECFRRLR